MGFFAELKRRHIVKVALVYVTVGFAVLQGAVLLLPRMDVPDSTLNLIIAVVVLGFPIALVVAWALEVTPEGVRRTPKAPYDEPVARGADAAVANLPTRPADDLSVAVLPLANLSEDPANEYFSDGITEEILMVLSKVQALKVISRTSVMRFKGTMRGVAEIAAELGVAYVVEGSVRRASNRVRITAQLIDARTDRHVWAESYDRELEDIFAIQTDVAQAIVRSLRAALTPAERERLVSRPTDDAQAYEAYLEARHLIPRRTDAALREAVDRLDRAVAADPGFALAWAARGETYALLYSYAAVPEPNMLSEARRSAGRALELDPGLGEAHAVRGLAAATERRIDEAEREYKRAIELSPGYALAYHWYANLLGQLERFDESLTVRARALELDPLSAPIVMGHGAVLAGMHRLDEAEAAYRKILNLEPDHPGIHNNLASACEAKGRLEEALAHREVIARVDPKRFDPALIEEMRVGLREGGAEGYWRAKTEGLLRLQPTGQLLFQAAEGLACLGRFDEAFDALGRLIEADSPSALWIPQESLLEPLHADPRWPSLVERVRRT